MSTNSHSIPTDEGGIETTPEPMGAKQTAPDPRRGWAAQKARLGGYAEPVQFTDLQRAVIDTAADQIIPAGGGFPAPSEVEIVGFVARYVTPDHEPVKYFPLAAEAEFKEHLDACGQEFVDARPSEQVEQLRRLERGDDGDAATAFFEQLKSLVYYGYYARPEVTEAIRRHLPAGRDYHGAPQPYGYLEVTETWGDTVFPADRGGYVSTADVQPVPIPDDLKSEYGVPS